MHFYELEDLGFVDLVLVQGALSTEAASRKEKDKEKEKPPKTEAELEEERKRKEQEEKEEEELEKACEKWCGVICKILILAPWLAFRAKDIQKWRSKRSDTSSPGYF